MAKNMVNSEGYTLLEMLIALVIGVILLTIAVPSFQTQIRNARVSAAANDLVGSLMLTKSESIKRNSFVSICKRNIAATECLSTGGWEQGWLVFVDSDADGVIDDEEIIYEQEALPATLTFRGTSEATNRVTYRPNGLTNLTTTQTIVLCDKRGFGDDARGIIITILGKGSSMRATDTAQTTCLVGS